MRSCALSAATNPSRRSAASTGVSASAAVRGLAARRCSRSAVVPELERRAEARRRLVGEYERELEQRGQRQQPPRAAGRCAIRTTVAARAQADPPGHVHQRRPARRADQAARDVDEGDRDRDRREQDERTQQRRQPRGAAPTSSYRRSPSPSPSRPEEASAPPKGHLSPRSAALCSCRADRAAIAAGAHVGALRSQHPGARGVVVDRVNEQLTRRDALVAALAATALGGGALVRPVAARAAATANIGVILPLSKPGDSSRAATCSRPRGCGRPGSTAAAASTGQRVVLKVYDDKRDAERGATRRRAGRSRRITARVILARLGLRRRAGRDRGGAPAGDAVSSSATRGRPTSRRPATPRSCASGRTATCSRARSCRSWSSAATSGSG